jgi:predicted RND superfamily exporter protein
VCTKVILLKLDVGPSMTITSATNAFAFIIGATTPVPHIRLFSAMTAVGIILDYLLELTFFASSLCLLHRDSNCTEKKETKNDDDAANIENMNGHAELGDNDKREPNGHTGVYK